MRMISVKSDTGNLEELYTNIDKPSLILMISNEKQFKEHVEQIQKDYPDIPCIGTTAIYYNRTCVEGGVALTIFEDVDVVTGVLRYASTMPAVDINSLKKNMEEVNASANDTVYIDFCTGNDACVLSTVHSVLKDRGISVMGGTALNGMVSINGQVYDDADVYAFVKNIGGRIKTYKENIYKPADDRMLVASGTNRAEYLVGELNGRPAKQVYMELTGVSENDITAQTFSNPLGKVFENDISIVSLKEVKGDGICFYRQVNDSDVLRLLKAGDYREISKETVNKIRQDFGRVSAVFSVNCIFRYLYFNDNGFMDEYLDIMGSLGTHCGFVGNGEHCDSQFLNQTMSCVVFE